MKTRSKRAQQEQQGIALTPPQQLATPRVTRRRRNIPVVPLPEDYSDQSRTTSQSESIPTTPTSPVSHVSIAKPSQPPRIIKPHEEQGRKRTRRLAKKKNQDSQLEEDVNMEDAKAEQETKSEDNSNSHSVQMMDAPLGPPCLPPSFPPPSTPDAPDTQMIDGDSSPLSPLSQSPEYPVSADVRISSVGAQEEEDTPSKVASSLATKVTPKGVLKPPTKSFPNPEFSRDETAQCDSGFGSESPALREPLREYANLVYNWPVDANETTRRLTVLTLLVNEQIEDFAIDGSPGPLLSLAIPTKMVPELLAFISFHQDARGTPLEDLRIKCPLAQELMDKLTKNEEVVNGSRNGTAKRKTRLAASEDNHPSALLSTTHQEPLALEKEKSKSSRREPSQRIRATSRAVLQENEQQVNSQTLKAQPSVKRMVQKDQYHNEKGMLTIGGSQLVPVSDDEEQGNDRKLSKVMYSGEKTQEIEPEGVSKDGALNDIGTESQAPTLSAKETPRPSGWGFKNLFPSAQLVSKFLPRLGLGTPTQTPARLATQPHASNQSPRQAPKTEPLARQSHLITPAKIRGSNPDVGLISQYSATAEKVVVMNNAQKLAALRADSLKLNGELAGIGFEPYFKMGEPMTERLLKQQGLKRKRVKREKQKVAVKIREMETVTRSSIVTSNNDEQGSFAQKQQSKMMDVEKASSQADAEVPKEVIDTAKRDAHEVGAKRKRSLDVIPNPAGGGYGMDLQYFGIDSDEDTVLQDPEVSPLNKKCRVGEYSPQVTFGDPHRAKPYLGTLFAVPDSLSPIPMHADGESMDPAHQTTLDTRQNVFLAQELREKSPGGQQTSSAMSPTTPPGPTMTFKVPSPGDSDSDSDEEANYHDDETSSIAKASGYSQTPSSFPTANLSSEQSTPSQQATSLGSAMSQIYTTTPPPVRPPLANFTGFPVPSALDKARQSALKHQPIQPSRLRETSRLSTSTAASISGADDTQLEQAEIDPAEIEKEFNTFNHYQQLIPDRVQKAIATQWDLSGDREATEQFTEEFAKWSQPPTPRTLRADLFPSQFGASASEPVINQAVLDRIEQAWVNGNQDHAASQEFADQFHPWLAATNDENVSSRSLIEAGGAANQESWTNQEEMSVWLA